MHSGHGSYLSLAQRERLYKSGKWKTLLQQKEALSYDPYLTQETRLSWLGTSTRLIESFHRNYFHYERTILSVGSVEIHNKECPEIILGKIFLLMGLAKAPSVLNLLLKSNSRFKPSSALKERLLNRLLKNYQEFTCVSSLSLLALTFFIVMSRHSGILWSEVRLTISLQLYVTIDEFSWWERIQLLSRLIIHCFINSYYHDDNVTLGSFHPMRLHHSAVLIRIISVQIRFPQY